MLCKKVISDYNKLSHLFALLLLSSLPKTISSQQQLSASKMFLQSQSHQDQVIASM